MRKTSILASTIVMVGAIFTTAAFAEDFYVEGYFHSDGTYVEGHNVSVYSTDGGNNRSVNPAEAYARGANQGRAWRLGGIQDRQAQEDRQYQLERRGIQDRQAQEDRAYQVRHRGIQDQIDTLALKAAQRKDRAEADAEKHADFISEMDRALHAFALAQGDPKPIESLLSSIFPKHGKYTGKRMDDGGYDFSSASGNKLHFTGSRDLVKFMAIFRNP